MRWSLLKALCFGKWVGLFEERSRWCDEACYAWWRVISRLLDWAWKSQPPSSWQQQIIVSTKKGKKIFMFN